jgi:cytochrome oxidase Cu insertion factor (SCO1/SenC/PrrC family)/thiol-disulfide isomerase/thioredoxin
VRALAASMHAKISAPNDASTVKPTGAHPGGRGTTTVPRRGGDELAIIAALAGAAAAAIAGWLWFRTRNRVRGRVTPRRLPARARRLPPRRRGAIAVGAVLVAFAALPILALSLPPPSATQSYALATNPNVDPGTPLPGRAPDFTLTDEHGQPVSLHSFRGKVVILAFNDSECTTICPLTTSAMVAAKRMLGTAGSQLQLLGVDANPKATSLQDVLSYSQLHGMLGKWRFLTGSLPQLRHVWKSYHVEAVVQAGGIAHTPAVYIVDPHGRFAKLYETQQSYSSIDQQAQVWADEAARLLPGHPRVRSSLRYVQIPTLTPAERVSLPGAGGGTVRLGPGRSPRLLLFFATWDQETISLAGQLEALTRYQSRSVGARLPALTAIDEGTVEPSSTALARFLRGLAKPLSYPVAVDHSGRVADGYGVQGEPWFVLTAANGRILWYWGVSGSGWPSPAALARDVRAALAPSPRAPANAAAAQRELAGSPAPLAAIHKQANQLLGTENALAARIRAVRGYPVVLNAWASWCDPCRLEFRLFASASAHYGRDVAFLGADTGDFAGDARPFLTQHPVSYPSYQTTTHDLSVLAPLEGLPTTIFINRAGKVVYVHIGQYDSQGSLDADIETYSLGG